MTLSPALPAPAVPERGRAGFRRGARHGALSTVVLRHGARAVKVYPPSVDVDRLRRVVAAVPADTGHPVLPELGRPPLVVTPAGTVSTYRWLEPSAPVTWAEIGRLLAALHATAGVDVATLPRWTPLSRVPAQLAAYAASPGHDPDVVAVLSAARERVLGQLGAMTSDLGWGLIHGDVSVENVLRDRGRPVFVDLDWVACGPREYDLVPAALRRERGEIDEETYLGFCAAYGHDVRRWGGLGLVEDVCELGALTFSLWASAAEGRDLSWAPQAARRWA